MLAAIPRQHTLGAEYPSRRWHQRLAPEAVILHRYTGYVRVQARQSSWKRSQRFPAKLINPCAAQSYIVFPLAGPGSKNAKSRKTADAPRKLLLALAQALEMGNYFLKK